MKGKKRGFTLVEIITAIGIISLVIMSLLMVVYNIQLAQYKQVFGQTVAKKVEYYSLLCVLESINIYQNDDFLDILQRFILDNLKNDPDLQEIDFVNIGIYNCNFDEIKDIGLLNLHATVDEGKIQTSEGEKYKIRNIYKSYYKIQVAYYIKSLRKNDRVEILVPLFLEGEPTTIPDGGGGGGPDSTVTGTGSL